VRSALLSVRIDSAYGGTQATEPPPTGGGPGAANRATLEGGNHLAGRSVGIAAARSQKTVQSVVFRRILAGERGMEHKACR
jgi:hypothetical protein